MSIKIPIQFDKVKHIVLCLMIFLWSWALTNASIAITFTIIIAVLKELFDKYCKVQFLNWLVLKGFYDSKFGLFLEKNRFIMPRIQLAVAKSLFDVKDILVGILAPLFIYLITLL